MRYAPSLEVVRLFGGAYCVAQLILTAVLPLITWFQVYRFEPLLQYLAFTTWVAASLVALLGLAGFLTAHSILLGLHSVLATALGACLGAVHTSAYTQSVNRCATSQASFVGCSNCTCALYGQCTKALLRSEPSCGSCKAMGTDICDLVNNPKGLLPYMGLACLLALALPAVLSLQAFCRLEVEGSSISNRLLYARNVVSREVNTLLTQRPPEVQPGTLEELACTLLAYGQDADKSLALRCCRLANLDVGALATTFVVGKMSPAGEQAGATHQASRAMARELSKRILSPGGAQAQLDLEPSTLDAHGGAHPQFTGPQPPSPEPSHGAPFYTDFLDSPTAGRRSFARSTVSATSISLQNPASNIAEPARWAVECPSHPRNMGVSSSKTHRSSSDRFLGSGQLQARVHPTPLDLPGIGPGAAGGPLVRRATVADSAGRGNTHAFLAQGQGGASPSSKSLSHLPTGGGAMAWQDSLTDDELGALSAVSSSVDVGVGRVSVEEATGKRNRKPKGAKKKRSPVERIEEVSEPLTLVTEHIQVTPRAGMGEGARHQVQHSHGWGSGVTTPEGEPGPSPNAATTPSAATWLLPPPRKTTSARTLGALPV